MYLFGDETAKIFSKNIKGKCISIGSIANNRIDLKDKKIKKYISFYISSKSGRIFPEIEKIILKFLKNFCLNNKLKLSVSTRVLSSDLKGKKL